MNKKRSHKIKFYSSVFSLINLLFLSSCTIDGANWHCVLVIRNQWERGRMLRWTNDFVQYGQRVYFSQHIDPKHYLWKAPDFSKINKGPYQDPLESEIDIPRNKYRSHFPYNIKKTKQQVSLQYLISGGVVYTLYEMPSGEFLFAYDNPYNNLRRGEADYFTNYFSQHVILVEKVHFDIPSKTLTETTTYTFTPRTKWRKRLVKKTKNGQIHSEPESDLTPKEKEQLYHRVIKTVGGLPKSTRKTSNCKEDNFIISYFRYMGNSMFNILRH